MLLSLKSEPLAQFLPKLIAESYQVSEVFVDKRSADGQNSRTIQFCMCDNNTLNKIFESAVAVGGLITLTGLCLARDSSFQT